MAMFAAQLQPWEENQSPSPTETSDQNPYELALARSRSSSSKSGHNKSPSSDSHSQSHSNNHNTKPASPIDTLQRQLSGDPEAPPPAWKRRSSINSNHRNNSSGPPSASRRHPGLLMTLSTTRQQTPDQMFIHESPNSSSTDLAELGLPQPAFRRRSNASGTGLSSNRSSMHSLTSEELWKMDQEANQPDLSNPSRQAKERPLDTVRRLSRGYDLPTMSQLPGEVIWPSAMDNKSPQNNAALRSNSTTSITKLAQTKKLVVRKRSSRNQSFDTPPNEGVYLHSPNSLSRPESMIITSSAHSSTTSLNSQGFSPLKANGNRPPSAYYSRDFLSSLAPREGGYAIAATMGNGLGAHGAMSVDERRRSQVPDRRAPMAKSAGMGRWSLDGGEHYARPYGTPSAATTASNLSAPPLNSPNVSPPVEDIHLPEGASAPYSPHAVEPEQPAPSIPSNPSPLSQHTHANDVVTPNGERPPAPLPLPTAANDSAQMPQTVSAAAGVAAPGLKSKMSKKDLKAAKVEAAKIEHVRKAEEKAAVAKAKADKKQAEVRAKEEMKRKEKEEKERRKAEKKAKKNTAAPVPAPTSAKSQVPFPRTSAPTPAPPTSPPRRTAQSMPLGTTPPNQASASTVGNGNQSVRTKASESTLKTQKPKLGFLGTLKKRFSSGPSTSLADLRRRQESDAANLASMPPPHSTVPAGHGDATGNGNGNFDSNGPSTPKEVRTSSMAAGTFNTPPPAQDFAPSSFGPVASPERTAPLELAPVVSTAEEISSPSQTEEQRSTSTLIPRPEVIAPTPSPGSPSSRSLAKVQSRDQASVRSARSASLHGPRPMPRPESISIGHPAPMNATTFRPAEVVTPTTSAESSMFSTGSQGAASASGSPFTSIDSRKNSLDGTAALDSTDKEALERQDSTTPKASEEIGAGAGRTVLA